MKLPRSVRFKIPALTGALALVALALLAPKPALAACFEASDYECDWSDGGFCIYSSCRNHPTHCEGQRTGDVTCFDLDPYLCCV
jgi:hypothetical protein